ncbi:MAG: pseudaminic acid synthase [Alphaproteobacteria bacterium]
MTAGGFAIAGRRIGPDHPPFLVAELSGNHKGDLGRALALLDAAHAAGADAVKLQTYTADTITIDHGGPDFRIEDGLWAGRTLHDLYREAHTPWAWHQALFARATALGLPLFSAPFDASAVDFLEALHCPAYKIASFEIVDLPLVERAAATGKPLILSTGMADAAEIAAALAAARDAGAREIALLHCVSGYPAPAEESNLRTIPEMAARFGAITGLSDHTPGIAVPVAAVALGAAIVEKHLTLRRADGGPDAAFSLEPDEFAAMTAACRTAWRALGAATYERTESERGNVRFRRSLYAVADIAPGERLSEANVRSIRPGFGLAPRLLPQIVGRRARAAITRGTPLSLDLLEPVRGT